MKLEVHRREIRREDLDGPERNYFEKYWMNLGRNDVELLYYQNSMFNGTEKNRDLCRNLEALKGVAKN